MERRDWKSNCKKRRISSFADSDVDFRSKKLCISPKNNVEVQASVSHKSSNSALNSNGRLSKVKKNCGGAVNIASERLKKIRNQLSERKNESKEDSDNRKNWQYKGGKYIDSNRLKAIIVTNETTKTGNAKNNCVSASDRLVKIKESRMNNETISKAINVKNSYTNVSERLAKIKQPNEIINVKNDCTNIFENSAKINSSTTERGMIKNDAKNHSSISDRLTKIKQYEVVISGVKEENHINVNNCSAVNINNSFENKTDSSEMKDNSMEWEEQTEPNTLQISECNKEKLLCVVVDTNVFIHSLNRVRDIVNYNVPGSKKLMVYVPWMVFNELDYQKIDVSKVLQSKAVNAIKYINKCLNDKNPKLIGQSVLEMSDQMDLGMSQDDKILSCTLQALEKYETVLLLSDDINLRNKAMSSGIVSCSSKDILAKIRSSLVKTVKSQKVSVELSILCSKVICFCCKEAYGDIWTKMDMLSGAPWSLIECLKRFRKYWIAVFSLKLLKQCSKLIDDFLNCLNDSQSVICDDSEEFKKFVKLSIDLCIYLKDIKEIKDSVQRSLQQLIQIAS